MLMRKHTRRQFNDFDGEELEWIRSQLEARSAAQADHTWIENINMEAEKEHSDCPLHIGKKPTLRWTVQSSLLKNSAWCSRQKTERLDGGQKVGYSFVKRFSREILSSATIPTVINKLLLTGSRS